MSDAWTPIHHEDGDDEAESEEAPPVAAPAKAARPVREPEPAMMMPIGMALQVPKEVVDAIAAIAKGQEDIAERLEGMETAIARLADEMKAAASDTSAQDALGKHMDQMRAHHAERGEAHGKLLTALAAQLAELQTAVLAPRRVTLERDKAGMATGAVSTPESIH